MSYSFLIVEDEALTARFIREILTDEGYQVAGIAKSADEARIILNASPVDCILLDINIHGSEDGLQFAQTTDQAIPIIFISAYSDKATLEEATSVLPYGFLVKPFDEKNLLAVLSVVLSRLQIECASVPAEPNTMKFDYTNSQIFCDGQSISSYNSFTVCVTYQG